MRKAASWIVAGIIAGAIAYTLLWLAFAGPLYLSIYLGRG